ncbi:MAG: hypothetical protein V8R91_04845 [Butyricimonas faecihominis]
MKDSDTGLHEIWTFNMNADDKNRPDVITGCYILDGCPDIEKAHKFQSQAMEEVMYYATDDKVYAVLLTASHPQALPKYEANPEKRLREFKWLSTVRENWKFRIPINRAN